MCLYIDRKETVKRLRNRRRPFIFYKALDEYMRGGEQRYVTPYRGWDWHDTMVADKIEWLPYLLAPDMWMEQYNYTRDIFGFRSTELSHGIHLHQHRLTKSRYTDVWAECVVFPEDVLAFSHTQVAAHEVFTTQYFHMSRRGDHGSNGLRHTIATRKTDLYHMRDGASHLSGR